MALAAGGFASQIPLPPPSLRPSYVTPRTLGCPLLPYITLPPSVRPSPVENGPQARTGSTQRTSSLEKETWGPQDPHHDQCPSKAL